VDSLLDYYLFIYYYYFGLLSV